MTEIEELFKKTFDDFAKRIEKRLDKGEKRFSDHGERITKVETGQKWMAKVGGGITAVVTTGFGFIVRFWPKT